jgi:16S rRNA (guanine966-N2)-methyltransferase
MTKSKSAKKPTGRAPGSNTLRIIGGQWRGRKLRFPDSDGLRPTPDRVRETLFNWLGTEITGARCLDLFAGSGALGLEALSRGAAAVDFVDTAASAIAQLHSNLQTLQSTQPLYATTAVAQLAAYGASGQPPFDIIFLDPPFAQQLLAPCTALIEQHQLLTQGSWVYVETGRRDLLPPLPDHWQLYREKNAGQVNYRLYLVDAVQGH